ncbi:MAG TPA: hypothetical protein VLD63_08935 [Anaerolineales bacterium]|nr:hypothetical protein [Anaerolineales bacterium]
MPGSLEELQLRPRDSRGQPAAGGSRDRCVGGAADDKRREADRPQARSQVEARRGPQPLQVATAIVGGDPRRRCLAQGGLIRPGE